MKIRNIKTTTVGGDYQKRVSRPVESTFQTVSRSLLTVAAGGFAFTGAGEMMRHGLSSTAALSTGQAWFVGACFVAAAVCAAAGYNRPRGGSVKQRARRYIHDIK